MKNLLIAVDLEKSDDRLLNQGLLHAQAFQAQVWIIHVADTDPAFVGYDVGPEYIRESRAQELREEHRLLQNYMKHFKGKGVECTALLIQGPTIQMLQEEIQKLAIDLLIMGERRHGFLYDTFIGHTSSKILQDISIPVLIVPIVDEN